jgi:formylglycine-generating enzyme required for sulfatase activity
VRPRFDWIAIPGGPALIGVAGAPADAIPAPERPATTVALPVFAIGRIPVTNAQYASFVATTGHRAPAHWEGTQPPPEIAGHPVTYVDWRDATAFCAWAGVRLPTEGEWEKAARGTDGRTYPWGEDPPTPRRVNGCGWVGTTTEAGGAPEGAGPYGALDMAGNVWEWTTSLDRPYPYRGDDGREDPAAPGRRILRGGTFNHAASGLRCATRSPLHPDACDEYIGFRVAADDPTVVPATGIDWVVVPAGPFRMGSGEGAGLVPGATAASESAPGLGSPQHRVEVAPVAISRKPVTNAQYAAFVASTGARPPGYWEGERPPPPLLAHPVTYVDWHEARAFCEWAGVRLPTEVEWEVASAGLHGRPYPWGVGPPDASLAWFGQPDDAVGTRPVGERLSGASAEGALDMAGNVWEWTSSLHRPYPYRADDGREDPAATGQRVLRGGSFRSPGAEYLRGAFRSRSHPTRRRDHIGFRVARDPTPDDP